MSPDCADILASKLHLYEKDYLQYTKCLCRGIELQLSARPEEIVRQTLLYYLIHGSELVPSVIEVKAEHNNLDVAIFGPMPHQQFRPLRPPLMIIEVKREGEDLLLHEDQLLGYMGAHRTRRGALFNGDDILVYEKSGDDRPQPSRLGTLNDLRSLIVELAAKVRLQNEAESRTFQQAENGDLNSFIGLVQKHGKYTNHVVTFMLKGRADPIAGCCFKIHEQTVCYAIYGMYGSGTQRRKPLSFAFNEFDKLLSLTY